MGYTKTNAVILSSISMVLYITSDIITKLFLKDVNVSIISLVRFFYGAPLIFFIPLIKSINKSTLIFSTINILNSVVGVISIVTGTISGFAIASQLRPVFIAVFATIFFREKNSYSEWVLFSLIFAISFLLFGNNPGIANKANIIFIITIALQAFTFSAFNQKNKNNPLSYMAIYNSLGFLICLAYVLLSGVNITDLFSHYLALSINAIIALAGSFFSILSMKTTYKLHAGSVNYLRLPITLWAAFFLFDENISMEVIAGSIGILYLIYKLNVIKKTTVIKVELKA
ncbi:hypothetical protein [Dickeya ananatis]|uniref:hypothetical protein n=1 Tax=Dickeya ananatis TaxID=3061286 RepID=UPI00388D252E